MPLRDRADARDVFVGEQNNASAVGDLVHRRDDREITTIPHHSPFEL